MKQISNPLMQSHILPVVLTAFLAVGCSDNSQKTQNTNKQQYAHAKKSPLNKNYFTQDKSKKSFSHAIRGLSNEEEDLFVLGKSFFTIPWVEAPAATTARDGLGPLFSANTCIHCHPNNGAGVAVTKDGTMSRSLLLRLSHKNVKNHPLLKSNGFVPDATYGAQLSQNGNAKVPAEGKPVVSYEEINASYPDGTAYRLRIPQYHIENLGYGPLDKETVVSPRIGLALVGLGLLERISEKDILAHQDIDDKDGDGISGKANYAFDPESNTTKLGRFTWKASATSVKHQSAGAAHNDMGLSNPLFPAHNCTKKQTACLESIKSSGFGFDLPEQRLNAIAFYLSNLAIPKQSSPKKHLEGQTLFKTLNCTACHVPSYKTTDNISIHPYSDLLLHDMGESLADGRSEFLATAKEWRTPALWGIGRYKKVSGEANYLHDGRARSIEEAILWHGGEAEQSKEAFMLLNVANRTKILQFLNSL